MTTMNTPRSEVPTQVGKRASPSWAVLILGLVAALVVGAAGGWLIRGATTEDAAAYVAGGGALTERQEQMVDLIHDAGDAWATGDAQALKGMFADNGSFTAFDVTYWMVDGSLQEYIDETRFPGLALYGPILVSGNQAVMFHSYGTWGDLADVFEFTPEGELLIVSHEVMVG